MVEILLGPKITKLAPNYGRQDTNIYMLLMPWNLVKRYSYIIFRIALIFYHLHVRTQGYITDVCVPISKLPQVLLETKVDLDNSRFTSEHAHIYVHSSIF